MSIIPPTNDGSGKPQHPHDYRAEVVLPDGRFARIYRHLTAADMIMAYQPDGNPVRWVMFITSRIVTIDDQPISPKQLEEMEWLYVAPINKMVNDYLLKMGPLLKGIS